MPDVLVTVGGMVSADAAAAVSDAEGEADVEGADVVLEDPPVFS